MTRLGALLAVGLALGCGDPPAPPGPREPVERPSPAASRAVEPTPAEPAPAERPPEPARECELGPITDWIEDAGARGSLALGVGPQGALVIALADGSLRAQALTAEGATRGAPRASALASASGLVALEARGERYVMVARGSCPESAQCFLARGLDAHGEPVGDPVAAPLPEEVRTLRRAASPGAGPLFLAWSTSGGHRALDRFELGPSGELGRMRVPLGAERPHPDFPVEILGLAADEGRWACVWRRGPTEDVQSHVYLTTGERHGEAEALHEALAIEVAELEGETLSLVATFELSRPHYLRLRAGEEEPLDARQLGASEGPPAPLAGRERAELDVDERGLWLRRRDAAGYAVGAPELVVEGRVEGAALARAGERLLVGYWMDGVVRGRSVRCPRR